MARYVACAVTGLGLLAGCGSGGPAGQGSTATGAMYGTLTLLGHEPTANAVQVAPGSPIRLEFDAVVLHETLLDEDTWLRVEGSTTDVDGTFTLADGGRTAVFTPATALPPETDYVFQLSPLTGDLDGRILEYTRSFAFRTLDATPPRVLSADVQNGATGRSRTQPITITCSEAIAPASVTSTSVTLRDSFGGTFACSRDVQGSRIVVTPLADLPGDRSFRLAAGTGVRDRAGNQLGEAWLVSFRTATDTVPPTLLQTWPGSGSTNVSPRVQPTFGFSEAMDPDSVEAASAQFQDQFGSLVPFRVHSSPDQRTLRLEPLQPLRPDRDYAVAFLLGGAAVKDVSGNDLAATQTLAFRTGTDAEPPQPVASQPAPDATSVSPNARIDVRFGEDLDPAWVTPATALLEAGGEEIAATVDLAGGDTVRLTPVLPLATATPHRVTLRGGDQGLRDLAGNWLARDFTLSFTTTADATQPRVLLQPADGATSVPPGASLTIVFDGPMDPASIHAGSCTVHDDLGALVPGTLAIDESARVVRFAPAAPWQPGAYYRLRVRGGADGVREPSGNWLSDDQTARFRCGFTLDRNAPRVTLSLNATDDSRRAGPLVPPAGFTIDVEAHDQEQSLDIGSVRILLVGPGAVPNAADILRTATITHHTLRAWIGPDRALAAGSWTVSATVDDLSGNRGAAVALSFEVMVPDATILPFERTQVVWLRTDLDRDGNGRPDFDDDLIRLGLASPTDPIGANSRLRALTLDAILVQSYRLLHRGPDGEPLGPDSVALRYTRHEPRAIPHMQMALGGLDPEGNRLRGYGDETTGTLGRAFYDHRNSQVNERNIQSNPGLGVFPSELFLHQARIHQQVWPAYQTTFARSFQPLCPEMGGTPAGLHPQDAAVLAPAFDPTTATTEQRARWNVLQRAIEDWSRAVGVVLTHEVGHSVGLVTPGPSPGGLFGDATLHDSYSGATEVMAPAVGYESMVSLDYAFRDVDLAYLRQRLLLP